MRAGKLKQRVQFQQQTSQQDTAGQPLNVWTLFAERYASVEPLTGREMYASMERVGRVETRFRIRYTPGIVPKMRIVWLGRVFDITYVAQQNGEPVEQIIMAQELVGESP